MRIPKKCFECGKGSYQQIQKTYTATDSNGASVNVPDVTILRCTLCGNELVPAESDKYISEFVSATNMTVSKAELFHLFSNSGLTQDQFAEAIGLGEKTFHRWLRGVQTPSRSMGFYLRILHKFPFVFKWVQTRAWRDENHLPETPECRRDKDHKFPALASRPFKRKYFAESPTKGLSRAVTPNSRAA